MKQIPLFVNCTMGLSIRYAGKEDDQLIADISHQTFYEAFAADNKPEDMEKFLKEQFTKGRLMLEVGRPENIFLLAYVDSELAGYVKLRCSAAPIQFTGLRTMEIARLYAYNRFIGKGVGSGLMKASIEIAQEDKRDLVWLGVWEKNQRAIDFYQRWGFEKFAETDFLLGDDLQKDWLMKKTL